MGPAADVLSLASYALSFDKKDNIWYCDVHVGDGFAGWCGLALYRHQPFAHEHLQICETPAWVYGAVLQSEQVAWINQQGRLRVTVGPVFDRYTTFDLDSTAYRQGVSVNLHKAASSRINLRRYEASGKTYFEGLAPAGKEWSIVKRRFGSDVASMKIHAG